jgi:O-antigen biosynthesis protein
MYSIDSSSSINTPAWWELYFQNLWDDRGGPLQSTLFMQALLAALDPPERYWLGLEGRTLVDWGCATGEGSAALAAQCPKATVWGLDGSATALGKAAERHSPGPHGNLAFVGQWAQLPAPLQRVDAVFCSNCLEHFDNPVDILAGHLTHVSGLYVALVPYKEAPLESYHLVSFDEASFPKTINGYTLLAQKVFDVDARAWPDRRQLWAVYASPDYMAGRAQLKLTVAEKQKWDAVYEAMPLTNDQDDAILRSFHQELLDLAGAVLPAGASVLEAGCGGGAQSLSLARDGGYAVTLLDFSPQALDYARRLFAQQNVPVQTIEADAFAIAQPSADMVFNAGVLEHYTFEEQVRFVRGMASRSHQYVMVLIPNRACYWYWVWRVQQAGRGEWPYGKEVPLVDLQAVFEAAGLHFVSQAFIGQRWTELFVEQLGGMDEGLKSMIGQVHQMGLVQDFSRGYLVAALASKVPCEPLAKPGAWHHAGLTEMRQGADQTALLADALSAQIAAHHGQMQWQSKAQELQTQASTLQTSMLALQEHSHTQILATQVRLATTEAQREAAIGRVDTASREITRLSQSLVAEQAGAQQEIARLVQSRLAEQATAQQEIARMSQSLVAEQTAAKHEVERLQAAIQQQQQAALRVSGWAQGIDQAPFRHGLKKAARRVARAVWQRLPLSPQLRQGIKQRLSALRPRASAPATLTLAQRPVGAQPSHHLPTHSVASIASTGTLVGRDWLVFAVIDWHFRTQRPQHLARELAQAGSRVFYISNHFVDAAQPGYTLEQLPAQGNEVVLYQVCLHVPGAPAIYFNAPSALVRSQVAQSLALLVLEQQVQSSCALLQHAFWKDMVFALPNSLRVYDCMDHHAGFGNVPAELLALEAQLLAQADLVITTSQWLHTHAVAHNPSTALVRNACEFAQFATRPQEVYRDAQGRKIIGYIGAIAEWFDVDLIRDIARAHPECLVLMVGNDTVGATKRWADLPNVVWTGEKPYAQLPYYLHAFDVALLPFKVSDLTLATNPVKVYEYLAAGKPVVAVDLPEMAQFGDLVHSASTPILFMEYISQALLQADTPAAVQERQAFAHQQTWAQRAAVLQEAVHGLALPKVSVVVLTYNNLDLTKACLASLLERSDYANLEIIVVDNLSSDGTQDYLTALKLQHPDMVCILNDSNLGFAAGNNVGLAAASGDYLVTLNNDTVVTQGWVLTMLRHFQKDASLGLLGPVTNNIGNEAKVDMRYQDLADMPSEARAWTVAHAGVRMALHTAAFFCVMLPRKVYTQCGPLCEEYGLGFFEDDDYCRRVQAAGLSIACAEDVFVHHHLSASFNKLKHQDRENLVNANKKIYEAKWGKWIPHAYRDLYEIN